MKKTIVTVIGIGTLLLALALLQLTTPSTVGPLGVLAFFILIYISFVCLVFILLRVIVDIGKRMLPEGRRRMSFEGVTQVKLYYFASVLALVPVILMGMRSVGDIRPTDIGLLVLFEMLACFYISKRF